MTAEETVQAQIKAAMIPVTENIRMTLEIWKEATQPVRGDEELAAAAKDSLMFYVTISKRMREALHEIEDMKEEEA